MEVKLIDRMIGILPDAEEVFGTSVEFSCGMVQPKRFFS
jgi:hypothetical protein